MEEEREITAPLDAGELQKGWAARAPAAPRVAFRVRFGGKTDLGQIRENNEDKFDFIEPDDPAILAAKGAVYAVADGMGGHAAGQIASEVGLKIFIRTYYTDANPDVEASLIRAVREANSQLREIARSIPGRGDMGTTLTAAVLRDDELFIAQVGDSRLYLLRGGEIRQITDDHSWVAEHVRRGTLNLEEAEVHPHRNVITRSVGGGDEVEPDVFALKMEVGDRFLLCSDGLSGMVSDAELLEVASLHSPSVAAWNLVELANEHGGKDNVTAILIEVLALEPWTGPEPAAAAAVHNGEGALPADPTLSPPGTEVDGNGADGEPPPDAKAAPSRASRGLMRRLFGRG